jgi:hypothetical protein
MSLLLVCLSLWGVAIGQEVEGNSASEATGPDEVDTATTPVDEATATTPVEEATATTPVEEATERASVEVALEPKPVEMSVLEARAMYELGLTLAEKRMWSEACAVFGRIEAIDTSGEMAARAAAQRQLIAQLPDVSECTPLGTSTKAVGFDLSSKSGDTELAITQSIVGTALGLLLPNALSFQGAQPEVVAAATLVGLGGGLVSSIVASNGSDISEGQAMAVFTGEYIGAWNGLATAFVVYPFGVPSPVTPLRTTVAGIVVGGVVGGITAKQFKPSAADMALVRSGASWGTAFSGATFGLVSADSERAIFGRLLLGTDLGLISGILLAQRLDLSRGRVNVINLAGYAGGVFAIGVLGTIGLDEFGPGVVGSSLILCSSIGLGVGTYLTRNGESSNSGGTAGVGAEYRDGRWHFGMPLPTVVPVKAGEYGVRLPLASGRF